MISLCTIQHLSSTDTEIINETKKYIWFDIILLTSIFTFYSLRQQLFKTTVDNYFWSLTFFLSCFSHYIGLVVKQLHFSNLVVRPLEKQTIHLKMYNAIPLANTLKYRGPFGLGCRDNFPVIFSDYLIIFFLSVVIKLCLKQDMFPSLLAPSEFFLQNSWLSFFETFFKLPFCVYWDQLYIFNN